MFYGFVMPVPLHKSSMSVSRAYTRVTDLAIFMKSLLSFLLLTLSLLLPSQAADVVISNPSISIDDSEFFQQSCIWQDRAGNVWLVHLDDQGFFTVPSGKEILVGTHAYPLRGAGSPQNGPEWGLGTTGLEVQYTYKFNATSTDAALAWSREAENWQVHTGEIGRSGPRPALNAQATSRVLYRLKQGNGQLPVWKLTDSSSDQFFPSNVIGFGRWVKDTKQMTVVATYNGIQQAAMYDTDTAVLTQLSTDSGNKKDTYMWLAPEYNEYLFFSLVNGKEIRIYRKLNGLWTVIESFTVGDQITSPEPFVFQGKSYISLIGIQGSTAAQKRYDVYVFDINGQGTLLNDQQNLHRIDPENLVIGNQAFIYYGELLPSTVIVQHKVDFVPN